MKKHEMAVTSQQAKALSAEGRKTKAQVVRRGEELIAQALELKNRIARDFWELGRVLGAMRTEGCHAALGYERFSEMTSARLELGKTTTFKLMAVAERLPQEDALRLGQEKAYALITYAAAGGEDPATLARDDAPVAGKPVSEVSAHELRAAIRELGRRRPKSLAELGEEKATAALVRELKTKLKSLGLGGASVVPSREGVAIALTERQARRWLES